MSLIRSAKACAVHAHIRVKMKEEFKVDLFELARNGSGVSRRRMRMSEEFGVDLFELTGDQSGGQEGEGKSEAREREDPWFHTIPYHTVPNGMVR